MTSPDPVIAHPPPPRTSRRRPRLAAMLVASIAATAAVVVALPAAPASASAPEAVFQPVAPTRLADSRRAECGCEQVRADTIRVQVAGNGDIPDDATAAALTITVTGAPLAGFATVWPTGSPRQETSNVNWAPGETRANGTIVQLGDGGAVDVYVSTSAFVLVDVAGVFVPEPGATSEGRFRPIEQERLLDTRPSGTPVTDSVVNVPPPASVPDDAVALAVTVTITGTADWGFVSAYPAGTVRPEVSVVNADGPGQTRAATAIVPMTDDGVDLYVDGTMHVLFDVVGWFTGPSEAESTEGRFVAMPPTRVFDTRAPYVPIWAGGTRELTIDGNVDVEAAIDPWFELRDLAGAAVYNLTATETSADGWITAYPARTDRPDTSTINWSSDQTVANLAITPMSTFGVAFYAFREADVIVDVTGYFTGPAIEASGQAAPNTAPRYEGESPYDLVRESVPDRIWNVLGDVDMRTVPALPGGAAGIAGTPPDRIAFAEFIYQRRRSVARSVAAHEVGHILAFRWLRFVPGSSEARVDAIGGHECLAEALGRLMFAQLGRQNYQPGYGTTLIACSTSVEAGNLAAEIVAATT